MLLRNTCPAHFAVMVAVAVLAACTSPDSALRAQVNAQATELAQMKPATPSPIPPPATAAPSPTSTTPIDESAYAAKINEYTNALTDSLLRHARLARVPRRNDPAWLSSVNNEFAMFRLIYEKASQLSPPERRRATHTKYIDALSLIVDAVPNLTAWYERADSRERDLGVAKLERASQLVEQVTFELRVMQLQ